MLTPIRDNIVLQVIKEEVKTASGLIMPDTMDKELPETATVVATGEDVQARIRKGSVLLFNKFAPAKFNYKDTEYLLIHESDVMAIVK